jgi:TPR repeat protein
MCAAVLVPGTLYSQGADQYRRGASQGNAEAQYRLGECYEYGRGVKRDMSEAVRLYRLAAVEDAEAQYRMGIICEEGMVVKRDLAAAVQWYRKSAEQGYPPAQNNLGYCYDNGIVVAQDDVEAAHLYYSAAMQGLPVAQYNIALCYETGQGVGKNIEAALYWFRKAALNGDPEARNRLYPKPEQEPAAANRPSRITGRRAGGNPAARSQSSDAERAQVLLQGARLGDAEAQFLVAECYYHGIGVEEDRIEALQWYRKALAQESGLRESYKKTAEARVSELKASGNIPKRVMLGD